MLLFDLLLEILCTYWGKDVLFLLFLYPSSHPDSVESDILIIPLVQEAHYCEGAYNLAHFLCSL